MTWDSMIMCMLSPLVSLWCEMEFGLDLGNSMRLTHLVRADKFWLFAKTKAELEEMLRMLSSVIVAFSRFMEER